MKESGFIRQNKEKWLEFDKMVREKSGNPRLLSKLFIHITDDLSYARTFYRNRSVRVYLNSISQYLFVHIYKNQKYSKTEFLNFWKKTLPLALYQSRRELLFSFLLFSVSFIIGMISSANDPEFARMILSDDYINMTLENIKNHDPMGVYKKSSELDMMFGITLNNLLVSAMTFISGILFSIGSVFYMLFNGVMVGTFQYFFIERGLFWESFLTIWQHGTLEISSIIIAGGAGIVLGKGLLIPGTYTRSQALRLSARKGFMILIGIAPVIVLAAFIESFFTRFTDLNDAIRLSVIIFSLLFVLGYYMWYPRRVARTVDLKNFDHEKIEYRLENEFVTHDILSSNQVFENSIFVFKSFFTKNILLILVFSLLYVFSILAVNLLFLSDKSFVYQVISINTFFNYEWIPVYSIINTVFFALLFSYFIASVQKIVHQKSYSKKWYQKLFVFFCAFIISVLFNAILFIPFGIRIIILFVALPFGLLATFALVENFTNFKRFFVLIGFGISTLFGSYMRIFLVGFLMLAITNTGFFAIIYRLILWNTHIQSDYIQIFTNIIYGFLIITNLSFILALVTISSSLSYFSMNEIFSANHLKNLIQTIGVSNSIRGYERE